MSDYRISQIEDILSRLDASTFQELCDMILPAEVVDVAYVVRTGSQIGKRKTRKGTPDTGFLLQNGKYLLVEYTTKSPSKSEQAFLKKLNDDLKKAICIYPPGSIERIILAFNSKLSLENAKKLFSIAGIHGIKLDLFGLDQWARLIADRYSYLAKDYLGLPILSNQVVSLKQFITAYGKIGFQPGLHHQFYGRDNDLKKISKHLAENELIFVSGKAGVGKTRLCIEAIDQFLKGNLNWTCLCIKQTATYSPVYQELNMLLAPDKNYLLFLDDANRQKEHLTEALEMLSHERTGLLRIIATVRDYSLQHLLNAFNEFVPVILDIKKLDTEQLTNILKGPDYKITNQKFQQRILKIAQGNVRIALMLAELALKKQDIEALHDVGEVYDKHFERIKADCDILNQKEALKVLGLVAFFYSIDTGDKEKFEQLLLDFSIDKKDFIIHAETFDALELLDMSLDKQVFRTADQTLATYLFYKIFIKDQLISLETLIRKYLKDYPKRMRECIISANNDFGPAKVQHQISPVLSKVWNDWKKDDEMAIKFLDIFWFYLQEECLVWVSEKIEVRPKASDPVYVTASPPKGYIDQKDLILDFLAPFLHYDSSNFLAAVQLGFDYVTKEPTAMPVWIRHLKKNIIFTWEDERYGYQRQQEFLAHLLKNTKEEKAEYRVLWNVMASHLLKSTFESTREGVDRHSVSIGRYPLQDHPEVHLFRRKIWEFLYDDFEMYPDSSFMILEQYPSIDLGIDKHIFASDQPFFTKIVSNKLSPDNFSHCLFVWEAVSKLRSLKVKNNNFASLLKKFNSSIFHTFQILDRNRYRNKELSSSERYSWEKLDSVKREELEKVFQFHNIESFGKFYQDYIEIGKKVGGLNTQIDVSLDQILKIHLKRDGSLGVAFLTYLLDEGNSTSLFPHYFLDFVLSHDKQTVKTIYKLLDRSIFNLKGSWLDRFFLRLNPLHVDEDYHKAMLNNFGRLEQVHNLEVAHLEKYAIINSKVFPDVLKILVDKFEANGIRFTVWHGFFEKHLHHFSDTDLWMLRKTYYIQQKEDGFDHDSKDWLSLVHRDPDFITDYFQNITSNRWLKYASDRHRFGPIWAFENAEDLVEKAIAQTSIHDQFPVRPCQHIANELFAGVTKELQPRAAAFLNNMVEKYAQSLPVMQTVFSIIRCNFIKQFESAFLQFISHNPDFDFFKKIHWGDNPSKSLISRGNVIWGEQEAQRWEVVWAFLNHADNNILFIRHKQFVKEQIERSRLRALNERRELFQDDDF